MTLSGMPGGGNWGQIRISTQSQPQLVQARGRHPTGYGAHGERQPTCWVHGQGDKRACAHQGQRAQHAGHQPVRLAVRRRFQPATRPGSGLSLPPQRRPHRTTDNPAPDNDTAAVGLKESRPRRRSRKGQGPALTVNALAHLHGRSPKVAQVGPVSDRGTPAPSRSTCPGNDQRARPRTMRGASINA